MRTLEDLVPMEELMKVRKKMRIIRHHVRFTRFAITSTVEEATFGSDEATFEVEQVCSAAGLLRLKRGLFRQSRIHLQDEHDLVRSRDDHLRFGRTLLHDGTGHIRR